MNPAAHYFCHDLLKPMPDHPGFDMVFLTAAMAQFDPDQQQRVLTNIRERLNPGGYRYNHQFIRRYFGKYPGIMLADKLPLTLLKIMERIIPGSNTLQLLVVKVNGTP